METKLPKLTKKREGFVRDFVETGNATEAVLRNFDVQKRTTATVIGSQLLTVPEIATAVELGKQSLREALEEEGVTAKRIAGKINELLDAKIGDEPNYQAIDKGIAHAVKIRGDYTEEPPKTPSANTYNFIFSAEVQQSVKNLDATIKELLIKPHGKSEETT